MPPSPSLRCSPGRELRAENHRRGRSLENGLLFREKDDDLALFNDMQTRESETFLLHSADDFNDSFSTKLRYFSDFKLGISIPVRGESSDLLNADGEKNDYDWLLTPPDTPLFPSLDDETPPVNIAHRGRPRSQPISISRSSTMEKSYRTSRSSASPHRLSPSPRSGNSTLQSRGKPSSAPHSSPTPSMRPTTPSRRPSTPPNKPSIHAPRSSTPTFRRMSTGSSGTVSSIGRSGPSPVKTNRGNSASPKLQSWQSNLPGFSSDAPPNLRTSLADRPASYIRGSSPASRKGRDSSSKFGRQSMSPTASRSASSSYSHDRERFSSHSKGSVASSGDDDIDSLQSGPVGISDRSASSKVGTFPNSRSSAFSKNPGRTLSSSSAPKRSFDSALRQMDLRKSPQNMFRPLLSSVPSTTFHAGKANSVHRTMISRNSSITTSSNASSEQGASIAPDTEGSDHEQGDMASECEKALYPDAQDEVFVFDKMDEVNEDVGLEIHDGSPSIRHGDFDRGNKIEVELCASEHISSNTAATTIAATASQSSNVGGDSSEVDYHENMAYCSKCGRKFHVIEPLDGNGDLCPDCSEKDGCLTLASPETTIVTQNTPIQCEMTLEENKPFDQLEPVMRVPELQEITNRNETRLAQHEKNVEQGQNCLPDNSLARLVVEEGEQSLVDQQLVGQPTVVSSQSDGHTADQQLQHFNPYPCLKVDVSEGAGISVLLLKRSSSKGRVVQGRAFTATNIPYDDCSYARDSLNSMRSSIGHGSASASSSVDLCSSKQTETRVQRQLSCRRADLENYRHDSNTKPKSTGSSFSGISNHAKTTSEEIFDVSIGNMEFDAVEKTTLVTQEQNRASRNTELDDSYYIRSAVLEEDKFERTGSCRTDASVLELSSCTASIRLEDNSVAAFSNDGDCVSSGNADGFPKTETSILDTDVSAMNSESCLIEEDPILSTSICRVDVVKAPMRGSLVRISGELENGHESTPDSQTDGPVSPNSEKNASVYAWESNISDHAHGIVEKSTVTDEGQGGNKVRNVTLEEATDTILFCSSIVHNLAYQAASIGMENDNLVPLEGSRPTVTILGKSSSDRKDPHGRTASKRTPKPQKARQRGVEIDMKTPSTMTETDVKPNETLTHDSRVPSKADNARPPKLESKCNCTVM
ncbi:hypothetical protein HHK36_025126 [Tetracentron sinense]|uniref:Uncharacterized protein n=1 Tax=Tetracentron sinense TaxID=13715 RepID=A0A834YKA4_TETSI|nr:hypothetical protein HHK36_025126 [Tetracentron sinense]